MDVFDKIKEIVVEQLNVEPEDVKMETTFEDLNADSLDVVELVMALEEEFDMEISDEQAENIKSIGDAVEFIKKAI